MPKLAPIPSTGVTQPTTVTVTPGDGVFRVPNAVPVRANLQQKQPSTLQQIDNVCKRLGEMSGLFRG